MSEETKVEQPTELFFSDFEGGPSEVLKAEAEYISKWSYASYEQ